MKFGLDFKKDQPQARILMVVSSAVILVIYFSLFLQPQILRLTDVLSKIGRVRSDLKTAINEIAKIDQFKTNIEAYREKVEQYEKRLPAEHQIPSLLEDLSNMAKSSNIKILGITPVTESFKESKAKTDQIYREMPIIISAKSGYHELGYFLSKLENADRFMKVVDIDIKANKLTPKKHDVELVVSTFILLKER